MGKLKDLFANALVISLLAALQRTATATGASKDVSKLGGRALIILDVGAGAAGTLDVTIEEADDTGFTVNKATVLTFAQVGAATAFVALALDVTNVRKFIRALGTQASTPDHTYGVTAVIPSAEFGPVTQPS